jgi:hypothetical protein
VTILFFTKEHFLHLREVLGPLSVKLLYGMCTLACTNYVKNIKRCVRTACPGRARAG